MKLSFVKGVFHTEPIQEELNNITDIHSAKLNTQTG
jgi:hypothetical protein